MRMRKIKTMRMRKTMISRMRMMRMRIGRRGQ
jgi:hypothetical protein